MNPIGFLNLAMQGGGSRVPDTAREMRSAAAGNRAGASGADRTGAATNNQSATTANAADGESGSTASPSVASGVELKETFLTLLVAQIKNQNPLNPADGTEFLSQLAQFTQVEQLMSIRQELEAMGQQNRTLTEAAARTSQNS